MTAVEFKPRRTVEQVEEGDELAPEFGPDGLLPCITSNAGTGEVLMLGWMSAEALRVTIETAQAHYFSRARQVIWRKGATSGLVQRVNSDPLVSSTPRMIPPAVSVPWVNHVLKPLSRQDYFSDLLVVCCGTKRPSGGGAKNLVSGAMVAKRASP